MADAWGHFFQVFSLAIRSSVLGVDMASSIARAHSECLCLNPGAEVAPENMPRRLW